MVMTVGAHQLGKHLRVTRIRLRTRQRVPIPIPRRRPRIDCIHHVARLDERLNPQATIGRDPDHHLARILSMTGNQFMQHRYPTDPFGYSARSQLRAGLIAHIDIVIGLGLTTTVQSSPTKIICYFSFARELGLTNRKDTRAN